MRALMKWLEMSAAARDGAKVAERRGVAFPCALESPSADVG